MNLILNTVLSFLVLGFFPGDQHRKPESPAKGGIANVSIYASLPDSSFYFAVIYQSGSYSASFYVPPDAAGICDGVIIDSEQATASIKNISELLLAEEIFHSETQDELGALAAAKIELFLSKHDSELAGKTYIKISHIDGTWKLYERQAQGTFQSSKLRQLDHSLMGYVLTCQKTR